MIPIAVGMCLFLIVREGRGCCLACGEKVFWQSCTLEILAAMIRGRSPTCMSLQTADAGYGDNVCVCLAWRITPGLTKLCTVHRYIVPMVGPARVSELELWHSANASLVSTTAVLIRKFASK